jgi:hypothetical protein
MFAGKGWCEAMRKAWLALVIAGLMIVWSASASAISGPVTLYDDGGPNGGGAYFSDSTNIWGYNTSICLAYDTFTLSSPATITGMQWWGAYVAYDEDTSSAIPGTPPTTDSFQYDIQSNPGGDVAPGGEITNGQLGTGNRADTGSADNYGSEIYEYSADGLDISLPAGNYFLCISDSASNPGNTWGWETSGLTPDDVWSDFPGLPSWLDDGNVGLAFNLTGNETVGSPVPEPATMALLGLGLAGLIGRRMRRSSGK